MSDRKLVVLGVPWDVDTEGLREYISKFGELEDCIAMKVAIDSATPVDDAGPSSNFMMNNPEPFGGYGGPVRTYRRMYGSLDFDDHGRGSTIAVWLQV